VGPSRKEPYKATELLIQTEKGGTNKRRAMAERERRQEIQGSKKKRQDVSDFFLGAYILFPSARQYKLDKKI
jgi:hypothetical protein